MSKYVCSCRALFAERKNAFDVECKARGHTLFEIPNEIYAFIYEIKEENSILKSRINKRNKSISSFKNKILKLETELRILRA
jgi:hypothetical protein